MARASSKKKPVKKKAAKKVAKKAPAKRAKVAKKAATRVAKKATKAAKPVAKRANATVKATPTTKTPASNPQLATLIKLQQKTINAVAALGNAISEAFSSAAMNIDNLNLDAPGVIHSTNAEGKSASVGDFLNPASSASPQAVSKATDDFLNSPSKKTETNKAPVVTKDHVTEALQKVSADHGMEKVRELLTEFKADRVSEIKEMDYPKFVEACSGIAAVNNNAASTSFL